MSPGFIEPSAQLMLPADSTQGASAETKLTPTGSMSVTTTFSGDRRADVLGLELVGDDVTRSGVARHRGLGDLDVGDALDLGIGRILVVVRVGVVLVTGDDRGIGHRGAGDGVGRVDLGGHGLAGTGSDRSEVADHRRAAVGRRDEYETGRQRVVDHDVGRGIRAVVGHLHRVSERIEHVDLGRGALLDAQVGLRELEFGPGVVLVGVGTVGVAAAAAAVLRVGPGVIDLDRRVGPGGERRGRGEGDRDAGTGLDRLAGEVPGQQVAGRIQRDERIATGSAGDYR